jgi:hypothetical protein
MVARLIATSPSRSRSGAAGPLDLLVVGNPGCRRVGLLQAALEGRGLPAATVVPYLDLLAGRVTMEQVVRPGTVLRIESPGRDFEVERALLAEGARVVDATGPARIGAEEASRLPFERGRIWFPRQWYLGFRKLLGTIERQRAACPDHVAMNPPAAIAAMFDKRRCHAIFTGMGIACPRCLGSVRSYEELRARMEETNIRRVFVKLAHGSSASGVLALEAGPRGQQAFTTVEMVRVGGEVRLYNSRRVRRYDHTRDIADLIDALGREGVHVEQWVPKAGLAGHAFDLRAVVIAGRAEHVVVRLSNSPMTNLHLKNPRGDLAALRDRMTPDAWEAAMRASEQAARAFAGCSYAGVDLVITPGFRRHAVLEINAFGDLLPGITSRGRDTYEAEVDALRGEGEEGCG